MNVGVFNYAPCPHSELAPKFLSSHTRQREFTYSCRQHFFKNIFPLTAERNEGNNDLLHHNLIKKYQDDLEHQVVYILYDLWVFQMWRLYSFVNNIYHIVWYNLIVSPLQPWHFYIIIFTLYSYRYEYFHTPVG